MKELSSWRGTPLTMLSIIAHESLEINHVPATIGDDGLKSTFCRALSLTCHEVKPDDLQACHYLKKKDTVIVKFRCRKQKYSILINRKNLRNKSDVFTQLNFSGRFFVWESMCHQCCNMLH